MPSRRRRSRRSLGTKLSYINTSVVRSAQTSVPTQLGEQSITDDALVQGAVSSQAIGSSSVDSTKFNISTRLPSGEATQRVPAPLTDRTYWASVIAGEVDLHLSGVHAEADGELEDIQHVEATNSGLYFTATEDESARIYLTGRMPIPQSRKVYATWRTDSPNVAPKLVWWKNNPTVDVETAVIEGGLAKLELGTDSHGFSEQDLVRVVEVGDEFDGIYTVLKVSGSSIYYVPEFEAVLDTVVDADFTVANTTATIVTQATGGFDGAFSQGGLIYVEGVGAPFDGVFEIASVDTSTNAISYVISDYTEDISIAVAGGATVRLYTVDTNRYVPEIFLAPPGKANLDEYVYVDLQDREIWGADGYTVRAQTYGLTNNVATLTTYTPTYARVGDTVTVSGVDAPGSTTDVFDGTFTIASVSSDTKTITYAVTSSNVSTATLSRAAYLITENQDAPSDYAVYVETAAGSDPAYLYSAKVFEVLGEAKTEPAYNYVTKSSLRDNVASLLVSDSTDYAIDSQVTVSDVGSPYDGTFTVTGVGTASIYSVETYDNVIYAAVSNTYPFYDGVPVSISGTTLDGTYTVSNAEYVVGANLFSITNNVVSLRLTRYPYGFTSAYINIPSGVGPFVGRYQVTSVNWGTNVITFPFTSINVANTVISTNVTAETLVVPSAGSGTVAVASPDNGTVSANTISYLVPGGGTVSVANVAGLAIGYSGVQHSELTPTGLTLYNADGSIAARLSSQDVNTLSIGDAETGQATINDVGEGTFSELYAETVTTTDLVVEDGISVNGDMTIAGILTPDTGIFTVNGNLSATNLNATANVSADGYLRQLRKYNNTQVPQYIMPSWTAYSPYVLYATLYFEAPQRWATVNAIVYVSSYVVTWTPDFMSSYQVSIPGAYAKIVSIATTTVTVQYVDGPGISPNPTALYIPDLGYAAYVTNYGTYGNNSGEVYVTGGTNETLDVFKTSEASKYNRTVAAGGANTYTLSYKYYDGEILDRFARGVIYHVGWDGPGTTAVNLNTQYTTFAAGNFYLENNRSYLFNVNFGNMAVITHSNVNAFVELLFSKSAINLAASGSSYAVAVQEISNSTYPEKQSIYPFTFGLYAVGDSVTNGVSGGKAQGGVPIYWAVRVSHNAASFTNTVVNSLGYTTNSDGPSFAVYDMGQHKSISKLTGTTGYWATSGTTATSNANTNTTSNTTTTTTYTKTATLTSSSSAYFDNYGLGDMGTSDQYSNQESLYQGNPGTSSGTKKSQVAFPAVSSLADYTKDNFTVTKVELYLRNRHSYYGSGLTLYYGLSTDTSARNSSAPPAPISGAGVGTKTFTKGQGQYIVLSTTMKNYFANNTARSVLIGLTSASSNTYYSSLTNYGYFDGDLQSDPPKLRITYTYTVTA